MRRPRRKGQKRAFSKEMGVQVDDVVRTPVAQAPMILRLGPEVRIFRRSLHLAAAGQVLATGSTATQRFEV